MEIITAQIWIRGKERSCERITSDSVTAHEAASRAHLKNELFHGEINKW
jgi:hypothetical protein